MPEQICVKVVPRASRNEIQVDEYGGIKVLVTSAPTDGEANEAVVALLAKRLAIAKRKVQLIRGSKSREKVFAIEGLDAATIASRLAGT